MQIWAKILYYIISNFIQKHNLKAFTGLNKSFLSLSLFSSQRLDVKKSIVLAS